MCDWKPMRLEFYGFERAMRTFIPKYQNFWSDPCELREGYIGSHARDFKKG